MPKRLKAPGVIRTLKAATAQNRQKSLANYNSVSKERQHRGRNRSQSQWEQPQSAIEIDEWQQEDWFEAQEANLNPGRSQRNYTDRLLERETNWLLQIEPLAAAFVFHARQNSALAEVQQQSDIEPFRHAISALTEKPVHQCSLGLCNTHTPVKIGEREVVLCAMFSCGIVKVPVFNCCCGPFEMPATECGCFPSSPKQPGTWFDMRLMDIYTRLFHSSQDSADAFCTSVELAQQGQQFLAGNRPQIPWARNLFSTAGVKYQQVQQLYQMGNFRLAELSENQDYFPGVCGLCPVCAVIKDSDGDMTRKTVLEEADRILQAAGAEPNSDERAAGASTAQKHPRQYSHRRRTFPSTIQLGDGWHPEAEPLSDL